MKNFKKNPPSVLIIVSWLGPFPAYYELWKKTVSKNPSVNWLVVSDNKPDNTLENVKHVHCTHKDLVKLISKKCDIEVDADFEAYKLCDFRVMYADMFSEYINGFDFWGFGDLDVMYGNIRECLKIYLEKYDAIGVGCCNRVSGPTCLFRNKSKLNKLYKKIDPLLFKGRYRGLDERHMTKLIKKSGEAFNFEQKSISPNFIWEDGNFYKYKHKNGKNRIAKQVLFHFGGGNKLGGTNPTKEAQEQFYKDHPSCPDYLRKINLIPSLDNININKAIYVERDFNMKNHINNK
tara:strand:- start:1006 stop:1878 length:873 start_codon:yes stop_codon:yes gene_type:complete